MSQTQEDKPVAIRVLDQLEGGRLVSEINEALRGATSACLQNGGAAIITLKLKVTANKHTDGQRVEVKPELSVKQPTPVRTSSLFFVDDDGDLSRNPPRQGLFFGEGAEARPGAAPRAERPEGSPHRGASTQPHSV